ncbi:MULTISPECIES: DUF92 domain-containing protein [Metabacillus]|uniref:DUF92 domain-containing protein n=2 Tax=Metabacillus TaxID=2675233 RepID=A0A179STX0_9BACI|nr:MULTISPECIES: DUF92 domain-containing protein [Metabacillus]OAS85075.1 hypothetical protein A6K24_06070 [Metabacillus litoralis]QNF26234.1 DUF92 domain-containing protein [Metabacillus sp. KUDC1714]
MLELELVWAFLFICLISYAGWKVNSLTVSGAIGAVCVGFLIYLGFSWQGLFVLGCFFSSSSFLSKYQSSKKSNLQDMLEKGDRRDIVQVMANGSVPAILGLFQFIEPSVDPTVLLCFCISIAAANADTWASEVGTLSKRKPRLLLTLKKVERGTSGAVSILGTSAALAGATFISIIAGILFSISFYFMLCIVIFGFIGNILDTLLGQTIQVKYKCNVCEKITEKQIHCSNSGTKLTKYSFLNNDAVNLLSIASATILGFILS